MTFVPQKAGKDQILADFLVAHPVPEASKLHIDIPNEVIEANMTSGDDIWQMFFDNGSRTGPTGKIIAGVEVVFVSLENHVIPHAFLLTESCSSNVAEYNALLVGLQLAHQIGVQYFEAYGGSKYIINEVKGEYKVCHEDLISYHHATIKLANSFDGFYISHVSCLLNTKADALTALTTILEQIPLIVS